MYKMKNKITGEMYVHVGKPLVYIDGVAFEQVTKENNQQIFKVRADSLERNPSIFSGAGKIQVKSWPKL